MSVILLYLFGWNLWTIWLRDPDIQHLWLAVFRHTKLKINDLNNFKGWQQQTGPEPTKQRPKYKQGSSTSCCFFLESEFQIQMRAGSRLFLHPQFSNRSSSNVHSQRQNLVKQSLGRWDRETPCHPWDIYEAPIKVQPNWTKVVASPTALSGKWWVSLNDSMTLLQSQKDWSISPSQQHLFGLRLLED